MTDILCKWLNEELQVSQVVEPGTFAKAFSSGYLFGEILHKHELQNDFHLFMKKQRSISMLSNFTRLEKSFHLLGIPFSHKSAQELMQEKRGAAAHIVYKLYISLGKKKNADMSGLLTQPPAGASLHKKEHDYNHLHKVMNREALVNLEGKYCESEGQQTVKSQVATSVQQKKATSQEDGKSKRSSDMIPIAPLPKPLPHFPQLNLRKKQELQSQKKRAQDVQHEIAQFERQRKLPYSTLRNLDRSNAGVQDFVSKPVSNSLYVQRIQQRLKEDALIFEQKDKTVDKFLEEQVRAREAVQKAKYEEKLIKQFTRPSKVEQRLVAQLQHIRKQKEIFIKNRLFKEQQIQERREKDLQEAVEREAVLAEQERMVRVEEVKRNLDLSDRFAADRCQIVNQRRAESCKEIVDQIVDLAMKVGDYQLSGNSVTVKQKKGWKELLLSGLPLYETTNGNCEHSLDDLNSVELKKLDILNNMEYDEYINMTGEWTWPEEGETKLPPTNNNILGSVVARLQRVEKTSESSIQNFCFKGCILGKVCSGKTSCLAKLAQAHDIHILSAPALVNEALNAYDSREMAKEEQQMSGFVKKKPKDTRENSPQDGVIRQLSTRAEYGQEVDKNMREGNSLPVELLLKIIKDAIQQIPACSSWILDGFPADVLQAQLLEKALVGDAFKAECVVTSSRTNLAVDPDPPKAPPPPPPALDLVLLFDVSDESAVSRAVDLAYEGAADSTPDYLYMSQIPHRVAFFQETWPKLEKWFGTKQNILMRVDASVDEEELFRRVDAIIREVKRPIPKVAAGPLDSTSSNSRRDLRDSPGTHSGKHLSSSSSSLSLSSEKEGKKVLQTRSNNPKETSKRPSTAIGKSSRKVQCLRPATAEALRQNWENVCEMYVNNIKAVMQELRLEDAVIDQHLLTLKEEFKHYLGRPDLRQVMVSHWQKEYNSVADDLRDDEETKEELHLRIDELCERLRNVSEKRKEENEQERAAVMEDRWLSDHTALLVNYHTMLMEAELDRFRGTFFFLKNYYARLNNKPIAEIPLNLHTISLLDAASLQEQLQKKLVDDFEDAAAAVVSLLPASDQQREAEAKQIEEKAQGKSTSANKQTNKGSKQTQSAKNIKGAPQPAETPEQTEVKPIDQSMNEYTAAVNHEAEAANVRLSLVKGHGLKLLSSVQSRAAQIFSCMKDWFEESFQTELMSIEQLSGVLHHHIESGAKLQMQLVLDHTQFFLSGDFQMFPSPPLPLRPPSLEKSTQSSLSISQLESLCLQFRRVAPNGLLPCVEFSTLFKEIACANNSRHTWPGHLVQMSEAQLRETILLLTDDCDCVNWRRFILSIAQPWPSPSVPQLLDALRHLKMTDVKNNGFIYEEQYQQTQLWFNKDTVLEIPEDPSEPLPYDRLANLHKFFFHLFADHSWTPPRLSYLSMLRYFAADPNPELGFVRALSLEVGQHFRQSSSTQLVKSMPSLEDVPEFSATNLNALDDNCSESSLSSALDGNQRVSIPLLLTVIGHSRSPNEYITFEHTEQLVRVFRDLGCEPEDFIDFPSLSSHPIIQHLMETSTQHQIVEI